jgi:hypothetical protein
MCVFACLPDLETDPPRAPAAPVGAAVCGDGVVDLELDGGEACDPGEAGALGCTAACQLDCPGGVVDATTHHCYFPLDPSDDYEVALAACSQRAAHLVTFDSEGERSFVYAAFGADSARFWVGLVPRALGAYTSARDRVEPGWASDCPGCFAHLPPGASDFAGDAGLCLADPPSGDSYEKVDCHAPGALGVICEREPAGASFDLCTGGFCITIPKTVGRKRYLYVPVAVTADDAQAGCRALGGSLAVFESAGEREALFAEVQRFVPALDLGAWIGLARAMDAGPGFVWDDDAGEDARASIWGRGEPRGAAGDVREVIAVPPLTAVTAAAVDVQLAYAVAASELRPYLCQY